MSFLTFWQFSLKINDEKFTRNAFCPHCYRRKPIRAMGFSQISLKKYQFHSYSAGRYPSTGIKNTRRSRNAYHVKFPPFLSQKLKISYMSVYYI